MRNLSKRSTVDFDPAIHKALKIKAVSNHLSVSELIDEALRQQLAEDQEDLSIVSKRQNEPNLSYEALLNDLEKHGKI